MGNSVMGIDIYVDESTYEAARELIETEQEYLDEEYNEENAQEQALFEQEVIIRNRQRRMKAWIILLFFLPGFLVLIIYIIIGYITAY
jgi:hypothetical protein